MHDRPLPRSEGIVTERVDDDLVVYDKESHVAHSLSRTAASVWDRCDGERTPEEIGRELALEPELVTQALDELSRCGLLDEGPSAVGDYSRREAAVRFAKVGGAAFAAPLIYSVVIGSAAAAASCKPNGTVVTTTCTGTGGAGTKGTDATCCSGTCYQGSGGTTTCVVATCLQAGALCVLGGNCCSGSCSGLITLVCAV